MSDRLPIIVLAGSDSRPSEVPETLPRDEMLAGPKGTIPLRSGNCLAAELIARVRASGCFTEPLLLGPRSWYEGKVDCELIHVEGALIQTLRQLVHTANERFDPHQPFAVTTCDILPTIEDFQQLLQRDYTPHIDSMYWWQMIVAEPQQMGASSWKPSYRIQLEKEDARVNLYPGHLVITRGESLRFDLVNRLLELAYRYRNRVLNKRYMGITLGALGTLLTQDIRNLARFQLPVLTIGVPYVGLRGYFRYQRGKATLGDVEEFLKRAFLHRQYHRAAGGRPVVISITTLLSFAKDIDTKAELDELDAC